MEVSVSSPKQSVLSPPDCMSDPEEHEISEEEDDDRNHKHRRKEETRSQSMEQDSSDQAYSRPYRKNYRHYENGNSFNEHEKRAGSGQRVQFDNQRTRSNQMFSRDSGPGRGRGNYGSWAQRDPRFNPVDLSSHMVQVGSMGPGMFGGRGLAGVSAAQSAPWPGFGMIPGVPNGGLDGFHHLQGSLRPPLNAPLNMGIPRQRCRDFEERGFCLRGDMCPMEHGMNRIVVDDVQSLSQFNLPVSVPGAPPHLAASSKQVPAQFGCGNFMNTKGAHGKINEGGMAVDGLGYGDAYPSAGGTDFYDPDQPLWNNSTGETSCAISALNSHGIDENVAPLDDNNQDGAENACGSRDSRSTSQSVWGRMQGSNSQANSKEKADAGLSSSAGLEDQLKEVSVNISRHGKQNHVGESVTKVIDPSNTSNDAMSNPRKPQKAMRTLFVNNVPHESNRRDLILDHFQKFGKVVDIHIPLNSERAFVQFSKREEAESALRAPDAVMGNRFIKLWWANRDSIPDNGLSIGNGASMRGRGITASGGQNQLPIAAASKSNHLSSTAKGGPAFHSGGAPSSSEQPKPVVATSGPKVTMLQQKKADTLERLKETLRKKQEMLEQKRIEFLKKMATLQKQGTVVKGEEADEPDAKRVKVDTASDSVTAIPSPKPESTSTDIKVSIQTPLSTAKLSTETSSSDSKNLKQRPYSYTSSLNAPMANRYKLDNRTTTIKVVPPLPTGLADVAVLKEHFSSYGELSKVELEDNASIDSDKDHETHSENRAACVTFVKRSAAEKAFANAKSWQDHTLQLVWVTRQSKRENNSNNTNNNLSVSRDHVSSKNKCASVSNDPKPATDEVKASSTEEPENTNVSGDNNTNDTLDEQETKECDNGNNNKSNSESIKEASEAIEESRTDEEQSEQMNG